MAKQLRNPFLVYLLVYLFEEETRIIFNSKDRKYQKRYLSIPRLANQTPAAIRDYSDLKITDKDERAANSAVGNFIQRPYELLFTDKMVHRVVTRLTFVGTFESFQSFAEKYKDWSEPYNDVIDMNSYAVHDLAVISEAAWRLSEDEVIYAVQCGKFTNDYFTQIIRLEGRHIIRIATEIERRRFLDNDDTKIYLHEQNEVQYGTYPKQIEIEHRYVIVDGSYRIRGQIDLHPLAISLLQYLDKKQEIDTMLEGYVISAEVAKWIVVSNVQAKNDRVFGTLILRLPDIIKQIRDSQKDVTILIAADEDKFSVYTNLLKFVEIDTQHTKNRVNKSLNTMNFFTIKYNLNIYEIGIKALSDAAKTFNMIGYDLY